MGSFDRIVLSIIAALVVAIGVVAALGDHVGVPFRELYPADQSAPPATSPIRITFGQEMKRDTVESRFQLDPPVEGAFRWEGSTLIFTPAAPLISGQSYTVSIGESAESQGGRRTRQAISWSFVPRQPSILFLSPDNGEVRNLWAVTRDTGTERVVFRTEYGIFSFAPSPDGTQIAVTVFAEDLSTDIWLVTPDGARPGRITDCAPGSCSSPAWSPDGTLLAYERQDASATGSPGPSRIWLFDVHTGETAPVFEDNQVLGFGPSWSPDGSRLAFFDANVQSIRVLDMLGGDTMVLPSQMGEVGSFAPDGSAMVFTDVRQVGAQFHAALWLARFGPEGSLQPLLEDAEEDQSAVWSPDGQWIAFARRRLDRQTGWGSQLTLYHVQTGEIRVLTDDPDFNNTRFEWSPDSQRILVQRFDLAATNGSRELWVYELADGSFIQLVANAFGGKWMP